MCNVKGVGHWSLLVHRRSGHHLLALGLRQHDLEGVQDVAIQVDCFLSSITTQLRAYIRLGWLVMLMVAGHCVGKGYPKQMYKSQVSQFNYIITVNCYVFKVPHSF